MLLVVSKPNNPQPKPYIRPVKVNVNNLIITRSLFWPNIGVHNAKLSSHAKTLLKSRLPQPLQTKIFSFINISGLALSLAAVWLITLFVTDELSYDRYHKKANRIYRMVSHVRSGEEKLDVTGTSGKTAPVLKKDFPEIEEAIRINVEGGGVIDYENKQIKEGGIFLTDPGFFNVFTYTFLAGNTHALEKPNTIVLTKSLAAKFFADPQDAINKTITIDKEPVVITGVMEDVPANSHFSFQAIRSFSPDFEDDWQSLSNYTYIMLKKNAGIESLRAKMPGFVQKYMSAAWGKVKLTKELQPLTSIHLHSHLGYELGQNRDVKYIYVIAIVGILILIIAFINYINITTARASVRLKEVAVRKIIGSDKKQLIGFFLTESVITILAAALISIVLVALVMPLFNELTGKELSTWQMGMLRTVLYILAFSVVTGVIGGLYPALFLSRFKTIPALKNKVGDVRSQTLFRKSLVLFQFAVTVVMITASLVIYLQLNYVLHTDLGFNKRQLLTFHLDSRELRQKVPALRAALLQNPQVKSVASAGNPIGNNNIGQMEYFVEKNGAIEDHSNMAYGLTIDADFLPAMQLQLLEGRNFSESISSDSGAVIVNEAFIKKHGWATGMGKRMTRGANDKGEIHYANIVGVVKNFHIYSLQHKIEPMVLSLPQRASERDNIYLRLGDQNTAQTLAFVEKTFHRFDAASPFEYQFLDNNFAAQYKPEEKQAQVLLSFTVIAICIACLGLFGMITFTASQRVKEIGVRKVLGASIQSIVSMLTGGLIKVVLIALLVAMPVSWLVMNKWLEDFAYRIQLQWWMFAVAGAVSLVIAMITLSFQAIRSALANPVDSLRAE